MNNKHFQGMGRHPRGPPRLFAKPCLVLQSFWVRRVNCGLCHYCLHPFTYIIPGQQMLTYTDTDSFIPSPRDYFWNLAPRWLQSGRSGFWWLLMLDGVPLILHSEFQVQETINTVNTGWGPAGNSYFPTPPGIGLSWPHRRIDVLFLLLRIF